MNALLDQRPALQRWRRHAAAAVCVLALAGVSAPAAMAATDPAFARFAEHDQDSRIRIDYTAMSEILGGSVYEVGRSDRIPGRGRVERTGTRINLGSTSRYRYEGNRVVFHTMSREHKDVISQYRAELESLPSHVPLASLSPDEQLAYWLNLHNIVVIDEIARRYPVTNVARLRIDGQPLHDAPLVTIEGQRLSLNDIRFNVVGANWSDPRVMYGFFSGSVGGPSIQRQPFEGARVWAQLSAGAGEFVNALRGVEDVNQGYRISPLYQEWRDSLFAQWPQDLESHLTAFADGDARQSISIGQLPDFLTYDTLIADLTNGVHRCGGDSGFNVVSTGSEMGATASNPCSGLPPHARDLVVTVIERRLEFLRQGRFGSVTIRDVDTTPESEGGARRVTTEGDEISN
ncbi:DUF547 domain-containing protein [Hyphomonadaceae bacterium BL14]|nr:DUF547 domain-containing protein [Hyphomonadaceae bacterium BL14]